MTLTVATTANRPIFGAAMIVGGMSLIGVADNFVRVFAESAGLWQFHFMRTLIAAPTIIALAFVFGWRLRPIRRGPALIRSAFLVTAMLLYFGALPMAPIAQVGAGLFTSPIWVLAFSVLIFREPVGPRRVFAVALGFCGVLMVLRPWEAGFTLWSLVPVAAGMFYALCMLTTRHYCAAEPTMGLNLLFFLGLGIAGAAGVAALEVSPAPALAAEAPFFFTPWAWPLPGEAWLWLCVQAFASILAIFMITKGYQSAETSFMTLFDYSFLISAGVTGWLVFGDRLDNLALAGMALIIGAGAFIALRSARAA